MATEFIPPFPVSSPVSASSPNAIEPSFLAFELEPMDTAFVLEDLELSPIAILASSFAWLPCPIATALLFSTFAWRPIAMELIPPSFVKSPIVASEPMAMEPSFNAFDSLPTDTV